MENAAEQRFFKKCTTLIMVISFAPNKIIIIRS